MAVKNIKVQIISKAGDKTVVGKTTYLKQHPVYKKYVKVTKKYMIHDENNTAGVGDKVRLIATRPLSKTKRYELVEVLIEAVEA